MSDDQPFTTPPPPPPPGQQPGYVQPGYVPPGYGQPGYGQPGYGQVGYPQQPFGVVAGPYGVAGKPYAGFGIRLGAFLLDCLLYGLISMVLLVVGLIPIFTQVSCVDDECVDLTVSGSGFVIALGMLLLIAAVLVPAFLYIRSMAKTGQTWGAQIVGVRVVTVTGEAPGWGKALGRTLFARFISSNIMCIGYLWMLWDDEKQTLQDKVVATYVVRE